MSLQAVKGDPAEVNHELLMRAIDKAPSIFVDAANCANVHKLPTDDRLHFVYTVPAESLYRFKPTLLRLPTLADRIGTKNVFISTIGHLFDYDDEEETQQVIQQCWRIIRWIARNYKVEIGVIPGSVHEDLLKNGTHSLVTKNSSRLSAARARKLWKSTTRGRQRNIL